MSTDTRSSNWEAMGIVGVAAGFGLNVGGTIYLFKNKDNNEKFLFALADLGLGGASEIKTGKISELVKKVANTASLGDLESYTKIPANKPFSASDLNLARGAEASMGAGVAVAGYAYTVISAFPWTISAPKPGEEVNNDYFSGADVSGQQKSVGIGAAYRFYGLWFKLWSFQ